MEMNRTIPLTVMLLAVLSSAVVCLSADESDADPSTSTWYCYGSTMIMQYPYDQTGITVEWTVTPYVGDAAGTPISLTGPIMEQPVDESWTRAVVEQTATKGSDRASSTTDVIFVHVGSGITVRFWSVGEEIYSRTLDSTTSVKLGNVFVDVPQTPSRNGYTFMGWFSDPACTKNFDPKTPILEDTEVYAGWLASSGTVSGGSTDLNGHVVIFQAVNGLEYNIVSKDETAIKFTVTQAEGHTFDMSGLKVLANSIVLTADNDVYTVSDMEGDIYITISGIEIFTVEYSLANVDVSMDCGEPCNITVSGPYHAEVSPSSGWKGLHIKVYMGGRDITGSCVNGGTISIDKVTANVVIVAEATDHWILLAIGGIAVAVLAVAAVAAVVIRRRRSA